ncbi:hypothetical protein PPL_09449 [Heterostelium album PN500]|uniref:Uncharacterized protein n=1 Tax=Heterostelium pallidum (strain ATCC 26659 / Pp 5 / PN500) TaxID=670386 RepID=D3BPI0_HETP5|nr:hypothetical protein PPL_09449 [Heterostelium album PN500]EFA76698.1 hypothetical protein PPL_09449 [Heterostelium album PN500]|eukprot:XP_020428830.1 hypothetical protein PPL_09449 [Heterostelium album PN500]
MDEFQINRNESWMHSQSFWVVYVLGLLLGKLTISILDPDFQYGWLSITCLHALITFFGLHWQKGLPFFFPEHQGKYTRLTLWEQIDKGKQYTPTRKFFTLVPIVLFMITLHANGISGLPFYLNAISSFVVVLSKMPKMDRVRIFGINKY